MATLQWDHAVQFVNQPEAAIQTFADQQLRAVVEWAPSGVGNPQCAELFWPDLYRISRHFRPG